METFISFLLGFGYVFLWIWGFFLANKYGFMKLTNVLLLVIFGLIYDNFIIASGKFIGEGMVLENLSYVRYWLHALFTPTLILFAWTIYFSACLPWAHKKPLKVLAFLLTIGLIFYEWSTSIKVLKLEPSLKNGLLTYESVGKAVSPVMVIIITLALGVVGLLLMIKLRFFWLLAGTLVMILGGILAIWIKNFPVLNVSEFVLIVTLLLTKQHIEKMPMVPQHSLKEH